MKTPILLSLGLLAVMLFSCAEKVTENFNQDEVVALEYWMKRHRPDVPKINENLYYKIHKTGESTSTTIEPRDWLDITFTGQSLDGYFVEGGRFNGNYYENLYPEIARQLGTFSYFCHYIPFRIYNNEALQYSITKGGSMAVLAMNQGDSAEVFMTSSFAYGSEAYASSITGFGGNKQLDKHQPAYMTFKLNEIIKKPLDREKEEVIYFAENKLHLPKNDSIAENIYLKITTPNPQGEKIDKDTSITVWYTLRFLDGFVVDSNIADTARKYNIYRTEDADDHYVPFLVHMYANEETEASSLTPGFAKALRKMRVGEKATTAFTSQWGYGATGDWNNITLIQAYTPLQFELEVIKEEE